MLSPLSPFHAVRDPPSREWSCPELRGVLVSCIGNADHDNWFQISAVPRLCPTQSALLYMGTLLPLPSPPGFAFGKSERERGKEAKSKETTEERNASIFKLEGLFSLRSTFCHGIYPTLGLVWVASRWWNWSWFLNLMEVGD